MAAFLRNHRIHVARSLFSTLAASPAAAAAAAAAAKEPSVSSFRKLKSSIRHATNPETIAEIFLTSSDSSHFSRDRSVFDLSVKKLTKFKRSDIIEQILEHQKRSASPKTEGFWIRIMMLYSKAGMVDQAISIFNEMEALGCKRTEKSFCAVLSVYLEHHQFNELFKSFEMIPTEIGISQSTASYNIALKALYAFRFKHEKSKELLESVPNSDVDDRLLAEMESKLEKMEAQKEVKPDINTYNIKLGVCLKKDDGLEFDKILSEISNEGLIPNLVTNNHKISRLCKKGECGLAKELLDEMVSKEMSPNLTSFNTVIGGFCKVKDFESAKSVFESMSTNFVAPDVNTYTIFVNHLVEHGEIDSALEFCKKGMERKYILPFVTMEGLVNGLVKNFKVNEAKEIVAKMKARLKGSAVDSWAVIESRLSL